MYHGIDRIVNMSMEGAKAMKLKKNQRCVYLLVGTPNCCPTTLKILSYRPQNTEALKIVCASILKEYSLI